MVPMAENIFKIPEQRSVFQCVRPWNKQQKAFTVVYKACSTLPSLDNIEANIQCSMHASTDTKIDRTLLTLR